MLGRQVLSFIKITNERYPRLIITPGQKRMVVSILVPIPMWAANEIKTAFGSDFPIPQVYQSAFQGLLYYHLGQCMASQFCHKTRPISRAWLRRFLISSRGRMTRLSMSSSSRWLPLRKTWNSSGRPSIEIWSRPLGTLRTKQRVMAKICRTVDVFGYYVDKGWMCAGLLCPSGQVDRARRQSFPILQWSRWGFLTYGAVYQEKSHLIPNEILIPQDIDEEACLSGYQGPQAPAGGEEAVGQSGH